MENIDTILESDAIVLWFDSGTLFREHSVEVRIPAHGKMMIGIS